MAKEVYYFTFGQNHFHPTTGEAMKDYWVEVEGNFDRAREIMVSAYGLKWSMQYNSDFLQDSAHYFPKGCYERFS